MPPLVESVTCSRSCPAHGEGASVGEMNSRRASDEGQAALYPVVHVLQRERRHGRLCVCVQCLFALSIIERM